MKCPKCCAVNTDTARFCSSCATQLTRGGQPPPELTKTLESSVHVLTKGSLVAGKYQVIDEIGRGGMGVVYKAEDTTLGRRVALKVLPEIFTGNPERMARFEREAKVLASLNHPNIATIYGLEETDGKRVLVMELLEGETLAERISRGPLTLEEALKVCLEIAKGVEAAHEKGIIHRDLKPANVKITIDGKVKVLDFGLAKAFYQETAASDPSKSPTITEQMTEAGIILGTAAYMSPEQARAREVDKRADIWAFGCILYECLTGRRAFEGETITDTLATILKAEPHWDILPPIIPLGIRELLRRCLRKDKNERLHDIADVRIDMVDATSRPQIEQATPVRPINRSRMAFATIPIFFLAAAGIAVLTWNIKKLPPQRLVRTNIDLPPGQHLSRGTYAVGHTEIALSPDGRSLIYSASTDGSDKSVMLYRRSLDQREATPMPGTEGGRHPIFSRDAQWIAFWAQGSLKKLSAIHGGIPSPICLCPAIPMGMTFGTNGTIIIGTSIKGLQMVSAEGGTLKSITAIDPAKEASHVLPYLLPGERALLFTAKPHKWGTKSNIEILSIDTGQRRLLIEDGADARYVPTGHIVFQREGTLMAARFDTKNMELKSYAVPVLAGVMQSLNILESTENSGSGLYSISDSGSLIYVPGGIYPDLKTHLSWVDLQGRPSPVMSLDGEPIASVRLSPDSRYLAYRTIGKNADVWVHDLRRGNSRKLTRAGRAMHLAWTPDGSQVTFAYSLAGVPNISWMPADGTGSLEILVSGQKSLQPGAWSQDGKYLVFVEENPKSAEDIWLYQKQGRQATPLFNADYDESFPDISPDGRWLAYCTNESGRFEVYVTTFPSPSKKTLISTEGGVAPLWSPDGRALYYWSIGETEMKAVDIAVTPTLAAGTPRALFRFPMASISFARAYDITKDGSRFVIPGQGEIISNIVTQFELVQGWFEELKRLVPTGKK